MENRKLVAKTIKAKFDHEDNLILFLFDKKIATISPFDFNRFLSEEKSTIFGEKCTINI